MVTGLRARFVMTANADVSGFSKQRRLWFVPAVWVSAYKVTSNSWEGTGDGVSLADAWCRCRAWRRIHHPVSFDGMIWPPSVMGILVTESVRGEGGVLRNKDGKRFMYDDIPDNYKSQTDRSRRRLALHAKRQKCKAAAGTIDPRSRGALHQSRGEGRTRQPARRRIPRYFLIYSGFQMRRSTLKRNCLRCTVHATGESRHHKRTTEIGPTTHYAMGGLVQNFTSRRHQHLYAELAAMRCWFAALKLESLPSASGFLDQPR